MIRSLIALALLLLYAPARAQDPAPLDKAYGDAQTTLQTPNAGQSTVASTPVRFKTAAPEKSKPDAFDGNDPFRKKLLAPGHCDWYTVPSSMGDILLLVEKGYLTSAQIGALASEIQDAVTSIPAYAARPSQIKGRLTIYVYDQGPISEADVPGPQPGERALMLRFVKEGKDPLFHELTHMIVGYGDSQSLSEGIAEVFQEHFRPGRPNAFVPANCNPDPLAKDAVAQYPTPFYEAIGAPEMNSWSGPQIRFDFYFASWSFVRYLISLKDLKTFLPVMDAGGNPASYQAAYGKDLATLRADWLASLKQRP
jgi:hypothetical protein